MSATGETTTTPTLDEILEGARQDFCARVDGQNVKTARRADELATDLAAKHAEQYEYAPESDEYDAIQSALYTLAGEMFPGNWEDYEAK